MAKKSNDADKATLKRPGGPEIASEIQMDLHLLCKLADVANHV